MVETKVFLPLFFLSLIYTILKEYLQSVVTTLYILTNEVTPLKLKALLFLYRNTFSSQVMEKITDQEWEGAIRWSLMFRQVSHTSSVPAEFESMGRAPQSMPESLVCISNALWEWTHFSFHLWDRLNVTR